MSIRLIVCVCMGVMGLALASAQEEALPSGEDVIARVNERDVCGIGGRVALRVGGRPG